MNSIAGRVLVTGANGFIGRELCRQLGDLSYKINVLLREEVFDTDQSPWAPGRVYVGDIGDQAVLEQALQEVELVFHLAGVAHVDTSDTGELWRINVEGTAALIDTAIKMGVKKIIYFSSSLAAAAQAEQANATAYGASKYQAEKLLQQAAARSSLKVCILRPVNVYGAGMKGNLLALIRMIKRGFMPPLPSLPAQFSLIGVKDLCRVAIMAASAENVVGKTCFVTDGVDYGINELEKAIYSVLGRQKPRWHCPHLVLFAAASVAGLAGRLVGRKHGIGVRTYRNLIHSKVFSNTLIADELGFTASTTFYDELPAIVAAMDKNS